ncbi:MAG: FeoB-associated Cys-rich membrane protein [Deltaproteobacteria bacterium]|nr:FeoB-associated Cys-rich membrane protein [Deltaproteobacteria bacterium]
MLEVIIVITIVAVVVALAVRSFYRTMTGKNDSCGGCPGACAGCAYGKECGGLYDFGMGDTADDRCRPDSAESPPGSTDSTAGHPR